MSYWHLPESGALIVSYLYIDAICVTPLLEVRERVILLSLLTDSF